MMRILIAYASNSSGAQQVADLVGDILTTAGHTVTVKRASESGAEDFDSYDLIVLGSCTWERFEGKKRLDGQLQQHMFDLVGKMKEQLFPKKQFAIFGLGDSTYTHFCAAADHLEKFVANLGGTLAIPTLRIDRFFFDLENNRHQAEDWAKKITS